MTVLLFLSLHANTWPLRALLSKSRFNYFWIWLLSCLQKPNPILKLTKDNFSESALVSGQVCEGEMPGAEYVPGGRVSAVNLQGSFQMLPH